MNINKDDFKSSDYDEELIKNGDNRNVIDNFKNIKLEVIKKHLKSTAFNFEIVIENLDHDFNMGTIIRNANAFNAKCVHIVGKKQWNKRGAMATDKYLDIYYYKDLEEFKKYLNRSNKKLYAVDIIPGAKPLGGAKFDLNGIFAFGSEKNGLTKEMLDLSDEVIFIEQFGSTRSVNVGVASGIMMYEIVRRIREQIYL